MALSKPYYRIIRPKRGDRSYQKDNLYSNDRIQLSRAYLNAERMLVEIFEYVEPGDDNATTYSFEMYTFLLRVCTEIESNFKEILMSNTYNVISNDLTMKDYFKIEKSSKLSKYKVRYNNWRASDKTRVTYEMYPFLSFGNVKPSSPEWYRSYNIVKHNREEELNHANLLNCINALAGLLVVLYSQFGESCLNTYGCSGMYFCNMESYDEIFDADTIFEIIPPSFADWGEQETYDFDWVRLKDNDAQPINKFDFNEV